MKKSSINFKAVTSYSEQHNQRKQVPDYVIEGNEKTPHNIAIVQQSIAKRLVEIKQIYSEKVKQKWQVQTTPIKEAVIVLDKECFRDPEGKLTGKGLIDKLNNLNNTLFDRYGIKAFQTYVHFDEGKKTPHGEVLPIWERNLHAHVVYDWQNKKTGKMAKLGRKDMADIQTITAETLGLQRGVLGSKSERLEHGEYREKMEELNLTIENRQNELRQLQEELERKKLRTSNLTEELKKWNEKFTTSFKSNPTFRGYMEELVQKQKAMKAQ